MTPMHRVCRNGSYDELAGSLTNMFDFDHRDFRDRRLFLDPNTGDRLDGRGARFQDLQAFSSLRSPTSLSGACQAFRLAKRSAASRRIRPTVWPAGKTKRILT
jgi:hypothetical protein